MNPRKYPRTMQEAFGPYTSHDLEEQFEYKPIELFMIAAAIVISVLTLGVIVFTLCAA